MTKLLPHKQQEEEEKRGRFSFHGNWSNPFSSIILFFTPPPPSQQKGQDLSYVSPQPFFLAFLFLLLPLPLRHNSCSPSLPTSIICVTTLHHRCQKHGWIASLDCTYGKLFVCAHLFFLSLLWALTLKMAHVWDKTPFPPHTHSGSYMRPPPTHVSGGRGFTTDTDVEALLSMSSFPLNCSSSSSFRAETGAAVQSGSEIAMNFTASPIHPGTFPPLWLPTFHILWLSTV